MTLFHGSCDITLGGFYFERSTKRWNIRPVGGATTSRTLLLMSTRPPCVSQVPVFVTRCGTDAAFGRRSAGNVPLLLNAFKFLNILGMFCSRETACSGFPAVMNVDFSTNQIRWRTVSLSEQPLKGKAPHPWNKSVIQQWPEHSFMHTRVLQLKRVRSQSERANYWSGVRREPLPAL